MSKDGKGRRSEMSPAMERVMRIAHEHILYARRCPEQVAGIAEEMHISPDAALALAIADQICEEFTLTER